MSSLAILKEGKGKNWQIKLVDEAIQYKNDGDVYQPAGVGNQVCVIHSCQDLGEPFDSARHRAASAMWEAVESMPRAPKGSDDKAAAIAALRKIWSEKPDDGCEKE